MVQETLWASLGRRRRHFGLRWGLAEAALGVAGVFQETLWVPRGLEEAGLVVAGASQETLWASRGPQECLTSIQSSISLQCLFWVSMLSFTSVLHLGLDGFLHFQSFVGWVSDWAFSIDAGGRDLSVPIWTRSLVVSDGRVSKSTVLQDVVSSRYRAGWLGMG